MGPRIPRAVRVLTSGVLLVVIGLAGEAVWVVTRDYLPADSAPPTNLDVGGNDGTATDGPLRLIVLGDSTAAGIGASTTASSIGGRAAAIVATESGRSVVLRSVAKSGARAGDLAQQVRAAEQLRPDIALVLIGANDATHVTSLDSVERDVRDAVEMLIAGGTQVVVGTCPDMGGARAFPQPLREIAAWRGRAVADVEGRAVADAQGIAVDLGKLTGPAFRADPRTLSSDKFHPSDLGYELWAEALTPALREAAAEAR